MRAFLLLILLVAAILVVLPTTGAQAQPEDSGSQLRVDRCEADDTSSEGASGTSLASQLYDRGLVLYEEGDYDGAIDAFVQSYCAKPHPASFYNIAQSYERLLRFELSIAYFERYIRESDPAASTTKKATLRAEVLRSLPAQIRVATVPAGAAITLRDPTGLRARGKANQAAPLEVVEGNYTMHIALPGYEDITRTITTKPGQPYSYYLRLEAQKGRLQVKATPSDARIFLDNQLVGVGSYSDQLAIGRYEIVVEAANHESAKEVVQIKAGEARETTIELATPPRSGRRTLIIASTVGLGITGAVATTSIFSQDPALVATGALAAAGVAFGGSYYGIPESTTRGDAWFMIESYLIGFVEGRLVGSFFACEIETVEGRRRQSCSEKEDRAATAAGFTGGLLGLAGSAVTHKRFRLSGGDAALLGSTALWGISSGALLYAVFDSDVRIRDPILFSGLNFGLVAGVGLLATNKLSLERVAIIDLGGVGGVLGGATLAQAFESGDERIQHFSMLGMVTGLVAATILTRGMDGVSEMTKGGLTSSGDDSHALTPMIGTTIDSTGHRVPSLGFSIRM